MTRMRILAFITGLLVSAFTLSYWTVETPDSRAAQEAPEASAVQQPETTPATGSRSAAPGTVPEIVQRVHPSVVTVFVERADGNGNGSGVIWSSDGVVVTNHHVVEGGQRFEVAFADGERTPAKLVASDPRTDLAIIRVDRQGLPAAEFATTLPRVGDLAIAMGSPLGFENSVTAGIVSGLSREIPSGGMTPALVDLVQTDAPISPGNSGGALVGADGRVIGINVAYIPPAARAVSIGFAIPAPTAIDVVEQLLENGEVRHAFLGVQPAPLTPDVQQRFDLEVEAGAVVLSVEPHSAAEAAGVEPGDVIISLGGHHVTSVEELYSALRSVSPGEETTVTVIRDGDEVVLEVTPKRRPSNG